MGMELQHKSSGSRIDAVSLGAGSTLVVRNLHRAKELLDSARTSISSATDKLVSFAVECLENMPAKFASVKQRLLYAAVICLALNGIGCQMGFDANTSTTRDASAEVMDAEEEQSDVEEEEDDSPEVTITDAIEEDQVAIDAAVDAKEAGMDGGMDAVDAADAADVADGDVADTNDIVFPTIDMPKLPDVVRPPVDAVVDVPDVADAADVMDAAVDVPDAGPDAPDVVPPRDVPTIPDVRDAGVEDAGVDAGVDVPSMPDVPTMPDTGPDVRDVSSEEVGGATRCGPCVPFARATLPFAGSQSQSASIYTVTREMNRDRFSIFCASGGTALTTNCYAGAACGTGGITCPATCTFTDGAATVRVVFNRFENPTFFEDVEVLCR